MCVTARMATMSTTGVPVFFVFIVLGILVSSLVLVYPRLQHRNFPDNVAVTENRLDVDVDYASVENLLSYDDHYSMREFEQKVRQYVQVEQSNRSGTSECPDHAIANGENASISGCYQVAPIASPFDHLDGVLLLVQGKNSQAKRWIDLIADLQHSYPRAAIRLIFAVYGNDSTENNLANGLEKLKATILKVETGTWTTGRNTLAAAAHDLEIRLEMRFKYWLFSDQDASLICSTETKQPPTTSDHACWRSLVTFLLRPTMHAPAVAIRFGGQLASINVSSAESTSTVALTPQFDAILNIFHRWSVPIVMPYIPDLDSLSWWNSQGLLFSVMEGCFTYGGLVPLGFAVRNPEHAPYPRGRVNLTKEREVLSEVYGPYNLTNWPINANHLQQSDQFMYVRGPFDIGSLGPDELMLWPFSSRTKACFQGLKPRFDRFISETKPALVRYDFQAAFLNDTSHG